MMDAIGVMGAMDRILGSVAATQDGPTVVGIGGLHGNEPAGVQALMYVLDELQTDGRGLARGRFVGICGNRPALKAGVRFLDRDLNRIWTSDSHTDDIEGREQAELLDLLHRIHDEETDGPVYVVDLHTTSGRAPPFAVVGPQPADREFAQALPVPLVLGLSGEIPGTLVEYLDYRGWIGVGFESGSHQGSDSVAFAKAALWRLLGFTGLLETHDPRVTEAITMLEAAGNGFPRAIEIFHHHPLPPDAPAFRMRPGFQSFQEVRQGEVLAEQGGEEVRAMSEARLLMPLYQPAGAEGFFLARTVGFPTRQRKASGADAG